MGDAESATRALAAKVTAGKTVLTVNRFLKTQASVSKGAMGQMSVHSGIAGTKQSDGHELAGRGNRAAALRTRHSRGQSPSRNAWGPPPPRAEYALSPHRVRERGSRIGSVKPFEPPPLPGDICSPTAPAFGAGSSPPQLTFPHLEMMEEGCTLHVRGIGTEYQNSLGIGKYERESELRRIFSRYGEVVSAAVRHQIDEDGSNTSW